MSPQEARKLLPEYLGGELDDATALAFEAYVARDAELASEVESLRGALWALKSLNDPVPVHPGRAVTGPLWYRAVLRYAAVIIFAFTAGHFSGGNVGTGPPNHPTPPPELRSSAGTVTGGFRSRVALAYAASGRRSGLARSLVALARANR